METKEENNIDKNDKAIYLFFTTVDVSLGLDANIGSEDEEN